MDNLTEKTPSYTLITLILSWAGLIILMSMYFTIPLNDLWMTTFGINEAAAIWIGSSFSLCYGICCLIYGPISDQYGRKIFLVVGICLLTIVTFLCSFVDNYFLLIFLRILQAIGAAAFVPISLVYIAELYPPEKRLGAIGVVTSSFLISNITAQVFASLVTQLLGWYWIFIILGCLYLITALMTIVLLPKEKHFKHENSILLNFFNIRKLFFNKQLTISFIITFMLLFSLLGMYTILGDFLSGDPFNFTENQIIIVRAIGLFAVMTSIFANRITSFFGVTRSLQYSLMIAAISLLLMAISNNILVILFSLIFVAGIALVVPINITLINIRAGTHRGTAVLFNAFVLFIGASLGPMMASKLMQVGNIFLSFLFLCIILLGGFFCSLKLDSLDSTE